MTFLQPFVLWGLPLLLLPVIIHLVNRLRHRTQTWAAMRFLLAATQSSTSQAKLRQFLILALRVLAVAMLVLFLGRPLAGGWLGWALSPAPDSIVLLLDRSASMEARAPGETISRRQAALQRFAEAARAFDQASRIVLIDSATKQPQLVTATALGNLPQAAATDTAADLPAMLQAALKWLVDTKAGATEVWIASDLQEANWTPEDGRWKSVVDQFKALGNTVRFRLMTFGASDSANTAVTLAEVVRRGAGLSYVLDLQRTEAFKDALPLSVSIGAAKTQTEIRGEGTSMRVRNSVPVDAAAESGWGAFEVPADANARDNAAYFVYGPRTPLAAAVVAENPQGARLLSFAASDAGKPAAIVRAENLDLAPLTLVVWQGALPSGAAAERLNSFIDEGGVVLFLPPGQGAATEFQGFSWKDVETAATPYRVVKWNEDQGPLSRTEERLTLPLGDVMFSKRQRIAGEFQALATFSDGIPLLAGKRVGRGEVYFFGSSPAADWSTLGSGEVLVPMAQRLLQAGARRVQAAVMASCGDLPPNLARLQWTSVTQPTGGRDPQLHAGVYQSGARLLAVNRPAAEDSADQIDATRATALFGNLPLQVWQQEASRRDALEGEIWRLFLTAMLLFLVVEGWLILPRQRAAEPRPVAAPAT